MNNSTPLLQKHVGTFRHGEKKIPFHFWSHTTKDRSAIDTVIFLGASQSGRITKWVAENAPAGTVIIDGLPHKEADRSAHDLKEFASNYTETALLTALTTFNVSLANIVAESQAAPGVIWTALNHQAQVKSIALISPLGLTAHILGSSPEARLKELKRRAFRTAMQFTQSLPYDLRKLYIGTQMLRAVLLDTRRGESGQKYAAGASQDMRSECQILANRQNKRGNRLTLILGERDKIFPPKEIITSVEDAKIKHVTTVVLKTYHASLAIRDGKQILRQAVEAVRRELSQDVTPSSDVQP